MIDLIAEIEKSLPKLRGLVRMLNNQEAVQLSLISNQTAKYSKPGVYFCCSFNNCVQYVGKTENLSNRMKDHAIGYTDSDLSKKIGKEATKSLMVKFIEIDDSRTRMLMENFLISTLNPSENKQ